ncbi:hypothetical protein BIV59_05170 [Bacillus sp. MUM 13]|nr:hypothetical protein BIV59_05170 [Bacillus sp. MUM 13]
MKTFLKDCCLYICCGPIPLLSQVDRSVRCETPAGLAEQVRPRRRSRGGSPAAPRKASNPGAEINHLFLEQQSLWSSPYNLNDIGYLLLFFSVF